MNIKKKVLRFGIPEGALQAQTQKLFIAAGYNFRIEEVLNLVSIDDQEISCILARPREIALYTATGFLDAGITTQDAYLDVKADLLELCDLDFTRDNWGKARVVVAVPEGSSIKKPQDLKGKRILTKLPGIAKEFLRKNHISAEILISESSTESKIPAVADAIIELTRTGTALKVHNLKILQSVMETSAILVATKQGLQDRWKKEKIENLAILLKGARIAQEYSGVMLHAPANILDKLLRVLPALKNPTITPMQNEPWFDIFTVVQKKEFRTLVPVLKEIGCTDIVEFPLNKVVL